MITFVVSPEIIGSHTLVRLPISASLALPSRGMVMVEGNFGGVQLRLPAEPDGDGGHWIELPNNLVESVAILENGGLAISIAPADEWPDPLVPADFKASLAADPEASATWNDTTTKARWDWVRWINGTANEDTRQRRIDVACSKLRSGSKRPCCFNRNQCSITDVSKGGILKQIKTPTKHES